MPPDVDEFASLPLRLNACRPATSLSSRMIRRSGPALPGEQREIKAVADRGPFDRIGYRDPGVNSGIETST